MLSLQNPQCYKKSGKYDNEKRTKNEKGHVQLSFINTMYCL